MKTAQEWCQLCYHVDEPTVRAIQNDARRDVLDQLEKAEAEMLAIQQEEARRIRHLNRLGSWAQQDCTGPIIKDQIQAWVLSELRAALGSAYEPTSWQPEVPGAVGRAERAEKENSKLKAQLSQVQSDYKILRKAEQQLKEAVWIIKNRPTMLAQGGTTQWHELCNVFLAPPPT